MMYDYHGLHTMVKGGRPCNDHDVRTIFNQARLTKYVDKLNYFKHNNIA